MSDQPSEPFRGFLNGAEPFEFSAVGEINLNNLVNEDTLRLWHEQNAHLAAPSIDEILAFYPDQDANLQMPTKDGMSGAANMSDRPIEPFLGFSQGAEPFEFSAEDEMNLDNFINGDSLTSWAEQNANQPAASFDEILGDWPVPDANVRVQTNDEMPGVSGIARPNLSAEEREDLESFINNDFDRWMGANANLWADPNTFFGITDEAPATASSSLGPDLPNFLSSIPGSVSIASEIPRETFFRRYWQEELSICDDSGAVTYEYGLILPFRGPGTEMADNDADSEEKYQHGFPDTSNLSDLYQEPFTQPTAISENDAVGDADVDDELLDVPILPALIRGLPIRSVQSLDNNDSGNGNSSEPHIPERVCLDQNHQPEDGYVEPPSHFSDDSSDDEDYVLVDRLNG